MANTDNAFGLRVEQGATSDCIKATEIYMDADDSTAVFIGDPLKWDQTNGGDVDVPAMVQAAAGESVSGVFLGLLPTDSATSETKYRAASTAKYGLAIVQGIKDVIFWCQEDSVSSTLTLDDVGKYCDLVIGSGDTTTGKSGVEIDSDSVSASSGQVQLLGPARIPDNAIGDNCIWRVKINESTLA